MTEQKVPTVSGMTAPGFEAVRAVFEDNFARRGEVGAAVHATIEGETVVDLWGGSSDAEGILPWREDTIVNVWSTTKGWLAFAMHMLADRKLLNFEAPVAAYWPEFAVEGKADIRVRDILTHTAGLYGFSMPVPDDSIYDWNFMMTCLERMKPLPTSGSVCAYHAGTFGWLSGEILRRITGISFGEFLRSNLAKPLDADVYVGLGPEEIKKAAMTIPPSGLDAGKSWLERAFGGKARSLAFSNPRRPPSAANTARWRKAEIPSSNGHASARGLARLYTPLALGGSAWGMRLLSEKQAALAGEELLKGRDLVTGELVSRSLGFMLPYVSGYGSPTAFGHPGMGGSLGFADPSHRLAFGYVMNRMKTRTDDRAPELCRALYKSQECLSRRH